MSRNVTELKPGAPSMLLSTAASDGNEVCTQISGKRCRLNEHTGVQMMSHCSLWPDRGVPTHGLSTVSEVGSGADTRGREGSIAMGWSVPVPLTLDGIQFWGQRHVPRGSRR